MVAQSVEFLSNQVAAARPRGPGALPSASDARAAEREHAIISHRQLVQVIVGGIVRQFSCHIDADELISVGLLGLIEVVDRFDPSRGVPFRAFAEIRIRGAIVDAIRHGDWVPRVVRQRYALIDRTRNDLRQRLGREPGREEMARALHLSPSGYDDLVGAAVVHRVVPLDVATGPHDSRTAAEMVADDQATALDRWIEREREDALARAIERLPESEREVIVLYYQHGLRYTEIARRMGVCESRVSQLRGQAVTRIQKRTRGLKAK